MIKPLAMSDLQTYFLTLAEELMSTARTDKLFDSQ